MDPLLVQILRRIDLYPNCHALSNYQVTVRGAERWVTLSGDPSRIPDGAAGLRRRRSPLSQRADVDDLQLAYWAKSPWFSDKRVWEGYIPDAAHRYVQSGTATTDWMYADYITTKEHLDAGYQDRINRDLCSIVQRDFDVVKTILDELQVYLKPDGPDLPTDIPLGVQILDAQRGERDSLVAILQCREALIERLGAISYALHRVTERERDQIVASYGLQLRVWRVIGCRKLGVLLDLAGRPDNDIPLLEFMRDGVPVHYPIDDRFLPDRRLLERLAIDYVLDANNVEVALRRAVLHTTEVLYERGADATLDDVPSAYPDWREPSDEEYMEWIHPTSSSRSSPTPSFSEYAVIDEILKIQRDPLAVLKPFLFTMSVPILTAQIFWPEAVLDNAYLLIEPLEEAKARGYAKDAPLTEVSDVLTELVQRGMSFRLAFHRDYVNGRLPRPASIRDTLPPPRPRGLLKRASDPNVSWARYRARVHDLLQQPNAVNFITAGGLLWRLALEFSPVNLPQLLSQGPNRRNRFVEYARNPSFLLLEFKEEDVDVLLGKCEPTRSGVSRSWWPTMEQFPYNDFFVGEWTIHHEGWFRRRLESIQSGNTTYGKPLVRYEWNKALEIAGYPLRRPAEEDFPTMREIEIARDEWERADGAWNGVLVSRLPLSS